MDVLLNALKAAGEPTRLRILLVLERSELTVTELCRILGQSQPRISRHLKLLCDAGLLARHAEGTSAYYRHAPEPFARQFLGSIHALADVDDATALRDRQNLAQVRQDRAELAARSVEELAPEARLLEGRRAPVADVEAHLLDLIDGRPIDHFLDIGTGTGRMLELFADRVESGLGIDSSREMLNLARTRLDEAGIGHCGVRYDNAYNLSVPAHTIDVVTLHHVLHFLDEPARAIEQAAAAVAADGLLIVVDYAPHKVEALRADHRHRRLGFADEEVAGWCQTAGLTVRSVDHLAPPSTPPSSSATEDDPLGPDDLLTITIWLATRPGEAQPSPSADRDRRID